jgi:hypothetical protein
MISRRLFHGTPLLLDFHAAAAFYLCNKENIATFIEKMYSKIFVNIIYISYKFIHNNARGIKKHNLFIYL